MNNNTRPKILIIGNTFEKTTGGGITLSNLFMNWGKHNIAVAATNIDLSETDICENYYQLGNDEEKWFFPFNLIQRIVISGPIDIKTQNNSLSKDRVSTFTRNRQGALKEFLISIFYKFLHFLSLHHTLYKLDISEKFIEWARIFKPDIIYSQLSSLDLIRFVNRTQKLLTVPLVIHMMDDWPVTIENKGILRNYYNKIINREFRWLLNKSICLLSICQKMSVVYRDRYQKIFYPFQNPIDLSLWKERVKTNWNINESFKIIYAGRIGIANSKSVTDIAHAVSMLNNKGMPIKFEIYTPDGHMIKKFALKGLAGVKYNPPVPHSAIPILLTEADLLVIPLDFDARAIQFTKYSMPTKTSEYMVSATPVLIYAPENTSIVHYAEQEQWGYVVKNRDITMVAKAIEDLYKNSALRQHYGMRAKGIAFKYHDADNVRREFHALIVGKFNKQKREKQT